MGGTTKGKKKNSKRAAYEHKHAAAMHEALANLVAEAEALERGEADRAVATFKMFVREARRLLVSIEEGRS